MTKQNLSTIFISLFIVSLVIAGFIFIKNTTGSYSTQNEFKKLPKKDRVDLAILQEFERTKELSSNTVPRERLKIAYEQMKSSSLNKAAIPEIAWTERGPNNAGGRTRALHFDLSDNTGNTVWAAGVAGGLWKTTNFTAVSPIWTPIDDFFSNLAITCFVQNPSNHNEMYFGTGEGWFNSDAVRGMGIWGTTNGGTTWTQVAGTNNSTFYYVQDMLLDNNAVLFASTRDGGVQRFSGGTWTKVLGSGVGGGTSNRAADLELGSDGDIYATLGIFSTGSIFKSDFATHGANTGAVGNWTNISPAGSYNRIELSVAPSNANRLYVFCQGSGSNDVTAAFTSTTGGSSWSNITVPTFCDQGTIRTYTRGQAWYDLISIVDPTNENRVYTGGVDAVRSDNAGSTWTQITSWVGGGVWGGCSTSANYVHADHHAMAFSPLGNTTMAWGTDGGISYTTNSTTATPTFVSKNTGYNVTQFYACDIHPTSGTNYFLAGAQDNGSHQFDEATLESTVEVTGGDGAFCHIDQDNSNIQITSYVRNNYRVSLNGGSSFTYRNFNSNGSFINPTDYDDAANILYCGNTAGSYFRWNDPATAGTSTNNVTVTNFSGGTITHVKVSPNNNNRIYFGLSNGEVVYVDNANTGTGKTGTIFRTGSGSVSCVEIEDGDEDHALVTYSNYGQTSIYETTNGGSSWTAVEGNLPDMPVRWALFNPNDADQAILATEVGVWSTDNLNGGSTVWGASNSGLANTRVDMLKLRASDDVVIAATHGRGLFSTDYFSKLELNFAIASSSGTEANDDGTLSSPKDCLGYKDYLVQVKLSKAHNTVVNANFSINAASTATNNADYEILETSSITFSAGQKSKNITIRVYEDASEESDETVVLDITTPTSGVTLGSVSKHTFTINDNDGNPNSTITQTLLSEDFGSGFPGTWSLSDNSGGGNWKYDTDGPSAYGVQINSTTTGNGFLIFDSDEFGNDGQAEDADVNLPVLDCSNYSNVTLKFEQLLRVYSENEVTRIKVSNNGTTFTSFSISGNDAITSNNSTPNPESVSIDISSVADGESTVYIKFNYVGNYDYHWQVDDVSVEGDYQVTIESALNETDEQYLGPNSTTHYYSSDGEIIATIKNNSSYDFGCTSITVDRAGTGATVFWENTASKFMMNKSFRIIPTNNSPAVSDACEVTLYYRQNEVSGWTTATGKTTGDIKLVKIPGRPISDITPTSTSLYGLVQQQAATVTAFNTTHYKITATFTGGFSGFW